LININWTGSENEKLSKSPHFGALRRGAAVSDPVFCSECR
jgi:hypothetical protein